MTEVILVEEIGDEGEYEEDDTDVYPEDDWVTGEFSDPIDLNNHNDFGSRYFEI